MTKTSQEPFIRLEIRNRLAVIHLNRLDRANAFHKPMRDQLNEALDGILGEPRIYAVAFTSAHPKIFCAGADVKELGKLQSISNEKALADLEEEYKLIWRLRKFSKPTVSLMNGGALGFGAGMGLAVSHPVMGEDFFLSMPEAALGFVPDVGASMFYGQLPGSMGRYLALTGYRLSAGDVYHLGLSDLYLPTSQQETLLAQLSEGEPIDGLIDELHQNPDDSEVHLQEPHINKVFSHTSIEAIVSNLQAMKGAGSAWAEQSLDALSKGAPSALQMILRQFDGTQYSLEDALTLEHQLAWHLLEQGDFARGIQNVLEKKPLDRRWSHNDVTSQLTSTQLKAWFDIPAPTRLQFSKVNTI